MVNMKYCKVQISNELRWFNHQFIILSQLLTMPKKAKIRSINVSKKWKTWYIKSESKTSIVLSYCEIVSHIISLSLFSIILCYLGKSKVEPTGNLTDHFLSGPPKDHSLLASHPVEPRLTDQSSLLSLEKQK